MPASPQAVDIGSIIKQTVHDFVGRNSNYRPLHLRTFHPAAHMTHDMHVVQVCDRVCSLSGKRVPIWTIYTKNNPEDDATDQRFCQVSGEAPWRIEEDLAGHWRALVEFKCAAGAALFLARRFRDWMQIPELSYCLNLHDRKGDKLLATNGEEGVGLQKWTRDDLGKRVSPDDPRVLEIRDLLEMIEQSG